MKEVKLIVHLKNGDELVYYPEDPDVAWNKWFGYLDNDTGCVAFGRFIVPKREIKYVENR